MSDEDKMLKLCYDQLEKFNDYYEEDLPQNTKLTVYCEGTYEKGFLINMTQDEIGLNELIVRKWITQEELETLTGETIR